MLSISFVKPGVVVLFVAAALAAGVCAGGVVYVDGDAVSGGNDGLTWGSAFLYLQDGLAAAQSGDEIRVAGGVYYPDRSSAAPEGSGDRGATFWLVSGVALRGGYAGVGAADPNSRDLGGNETILCGDLAGDDVGRTNSDENSFQVVTAVDVGKTTILDGFTITGGYAYGGTSEPRHGGGIYSRGGGATFINCRVIGNQADQGGGMYNDSSSPSVMNCYIMGNRAGDCGGGMYNLWSDPVIKNCVFSGNYAWDWGGGGMWHCGNRAKLINCTFVGNLASDGGSGIYAKAGTVEISNCIIQEEISLYGGSVEASFSNLPAALGGVGNIDADPLFVDADGVDDLFGTLDDDSRLAVGSPCINAGDPGRIVDPNETDLDGNGRIANGVVDMGAYEFGVTPSLAAQWKLDEADGVAAKDSAGGNDGRTVGDPVWAPDGGRVDGALEFDGYGDYVNCGRGAAFDIRDAITISAWIKVAGSMKPFEAIITKGDDAWRLQGVSANDIPGTLEFACTGITVPGNTWGHVEGTIPVDDGMWHHVAGVYDGKTISLYVDGVLDVKNVGSGVINVNDFDVLIGENADRPGRFWDGLIDDLRVYNYALSAEEIGELATPVTSYHVDIQGGSNDNDGYSRQTALRDIMEGVLRAEAGDTVLVWPGVYNEQVTFLPDRAITLRSAAEAAVMEVDAVGGYAFAFQFNEGPESVLSNFVIRNSSRGVFCNWASPAITNLTVVNCEFGIVAYGEVVPDVSNCIFWNNRYGNTSGCGSRNSWDWRPEGAAAWWRFEGGAGTTAFDWAGSNHGVVVGDGLRSEGASGEALEFDGVDDYVLIPDSALLSVGRGDYTLSAWVKPDSVEGIQTVTGKMTGMSDKEYLFYIDEGRLRLDVERDSNNGRAYSEAVVEAGVWQHVAVAFDSSSLRATFYRNGSVVGQEISELPITALPRGLGADVWIGMRSDGGYGGRGFSGLIDEVMIFGRRLLPEEMSVVYYSGVNPQFADAANGDYHLRSEWGRYVPLDPAAYGGIAGLWTFDDVTSPCVDGGDPDVRPAREPAPNGGRVNMGAYGNTPSASRSEWSLKGDLNRDGAVDLVDFAIMGSEWLGVLPWMAGSG